MTATSRGWTRIPLTAALALVFIIALPACDRPRTQVLLTRGTPEVTPTSARLAASTATPQVTVAASPAATASPTATARPPATATATATGLPSPTPAKPLPTPSATATSTSMPTSTPQVRVHIVRAGETLAIIARKYATTATIIARYNGLSNPNRIYVGQRLIIP